MSFELTTKSGKEPGKGLSDLIKALTKESGDVKIGFLGEKNNARTDGEMTNAELASIHEYGTSTIPARPFIGPTVIENRAKYTKFLEAGIKKALHGRPEDMTKTLALVGEMATADIRNAVLKNNIPPPLQAATIKRKGSSKPLVDTGQMIRAVTYTVTRSDGKPAHHKPEHAPKHAAAHAQGAEEGPTVLSFGGSSDSAGGKKKRKKRR